MVFRGLEKLRDMFNEATDLGLIFSELGVEHKSFWWAGESGFIVSGVYGDRFVGPGFS